MRRYNPKEIEPKWQQKWADDRIYKTDLNLTLGKHYIIPMLPYPSGDLHIGHWYNFAPTDTVARFRRMIGGNVLTTIGFDAWGVPAENAAIERHIQPATWTHGNVKTMTGQLEKIGASYDWSHSLSTCDPAYYRWNQWLFLKLFKQGLAYRSKGVVNWCPKDQTVLANEQVVGDDNACERCGTPVIQKELEQWYFKITDYAEQLLTGLETIDWPERVKTMQANWIGKSEGALIEFRIENSESMVGVFTTRPDTLYGATYMVLAPEHPQVANLITPDQKKAVEDYLKQASRKTELERKEGEKDKTGVFTGSYAINPASDEKVPIWVADYVLMGYGSGAIMAVPAHDERDWQFAQKYNLPIVEVIEKPADIEGAYSGEGKVINSSGYNGLNSAAVREKIIIDLAKKNAVKGQVNYKLRDWLISRQRYWGTPIPIIYCDDCGIVPVPEESLPVILPEDVEFELSGRSPLQDRPDFVNTQCPKCSKLAKRETDTMDTFVDSSWYFLRYLDSHNDNAIFDTQLVNKWMPVDHYIGGIEHAILHLLYARFITKFLYDHHGLVFNEPFKKLTNQGIILGSDGQKMSKRRGNVVNPDEQVASYGADSLRLYLMFMGPYNQGGPYNLGGITGTRRFLDRVWVAVNEFIDQPADNQTRNNERELNQTIHKTIKKVTQDMEKLNFNTAIAALMSFVNELYKLKAGQNLSKAGPWKEAWKEAIETLLKLLAPFAPHFSEELLQELGHEGSIHSAKWPTWDETLIVEDTITLAVQVNGKLRAEITVPTDTDENQAIESAKMEPKVSKILADKQLKKAIYVSGRLVNLVLE